MAKSTKRPSLYSPAGRTDRGDNCFATYVGNRLSMVRRVGLPLCRRRYYVEARATRPLAQHSGRRGGTVGRRVLHGRGPVER